MDRRKQISEARNFGNPWLRWRVWQRLLLALVLVGLFTTTVGVPKAQASERIEPEGFILYGDNQFWGSYVPDELGDHLRDLQTTSRTIKQVAFRWDARQSGWGFATPGPGWVVLYGYHGYWAQDVPQSLLTALSQLHEQNVELTQVAFAPGGGWVILYGRNGYWAHDVPQGLIDTLRRLNQKYEVIKQVAFAPGGGWVILYGRKGYWAQDVPQRSIDALDELNSQNKEITQVAFTRYGDWVITFGRNGFRRTRGIGPIEAKLLELNGQGEQIKEAIFL